MTDRQRVAKLDAAVRSLKRTTKGYTPSGPHWKAAMAQLDELRADLDRPLIPALGPIRAGGKSVLLHDCTHLTSGLGWPAFDDDVDFDNQPDGVQVIAPEDGFVDDNTSGAQGGEAFYFSGASGIRYWVAHITTVPRQGRVFKQGAVMTKVSGDHPVPHVHLGVDARKLLNGKHLVSHVNYTHGAPLIGVQLARA